MQIIYFTTGVNFSYKYTRYLNQQTKNHFMSKFSTIKQKYLLRGFKEDNIDFAISAVKDGNKREHIIEGLTADYRGMTTEQSNPLLDELFIAFGGEFKKENQGGYLYGTLLLLVGVAGAAGFIAMLISGEGKMKFILLSIAAAVFGLFSGAVLMVKAFKGKYRESDAPFTN